MQDIKQEIEQLKQKLSELEQKCTESMFEYPIYKKSRSGQVVKFIGLTTGICMQRGKSILQVGTLNHLYAPHTNTDIWQDVPYDTERDLYHGQPIECWSNDCTHLRELRFYDAVNSCTFNYRGEPDGLKYDNYKALENPPQWMLDAYRTLNI